MANVGDSLNDRFRLDREVGRGGFAAVYLATDLLLSGPDRQRLVAVKVLHPQLIAQIEERDFLARFKEEASLVSTLEHPNILGLYDYGEADGIPYFVMPYVSGGTLYDQIRGGRALALAATAAYLRQAAAALDYAHRRSLVHRDVKPQNMLLREDGESLLLSDFGIARMLSSVTTHSRTGIVGTVAYMAPEQFQGRVSTRSDIYALGCVLFQLLTGALPFTGPTQQVMYGHIAGPIPSIVERSGGRVPPSVQAIIERSLAKQPQDRFASAGELARAFATTIGSVAGTAIPFGSGAPAQRLPQPTIDAPPPPPLPTTVDVPPPIPLSTTVDASPPWPMPTTASEVLQREPLTSTTPGEQPGDERLSLRYSEATGAIERAEWERSIALLRPIVAQSPDYRDAATLLMRAEQQRRQSALNATLPAASMGRTVAGVPPPLPANRTDSRPVNAPPIAAPPRDPPTRRGFRIGPFSLGAGAVAGIAALCVVGTIALGAIIRPGPSPTATTAPPPRPTAVLAASTAPTTTTPTPRPTVPPTPPPTSSPPPTATATVGVTPAPSSGGLPGGNPSASNSPSPETAPQPTACFPAGAASSSVPAPPSLPPRPATPTRSSTPNTPRCFFVVARTGVDGLALRDRPYLNARNFNVFPDGTRLEQSGPDIFEDKIWWRRVRVGNQEGYVRAKFTDLVP